LSQSTGTGGRHGYATALADLWYALTQTLGRLEALAAEPNEDTGEQLPALQYALHVAGERFAGLEPPPGHEDAHEELQTAIADARDATAEVADAFAHGGLAAAHPLVWEWRGALFGVRLARSRVPAEPPREPTVASVRNRRKNEAAVFAVLALPIVAVVAIAAAAGAAGWTIAVALLVVLALGLALRRA
jgi:nitrate reductase NapE component